MGQRLSLFLKQRRLRSKSKGTEAPIFPTELINKIICNCGLPTLFQLRLMSRNVQSLVDSSARLKKSLLNVRIHLGCLTLKEFVKNAPRSLPLSNFCISFPLYNDWDPPGRGGPSIYSDGTPFFKITPQPRAFLEFFGPGIKKFQVPTIFCGTVDEELEFFRSLPNLRDLEITSLKPLDNGLFYMSDLEVKSRRAVAVESNLVLKRLVVKFELGSGDYLINWGSSVVLCLKKLSFRNRCAVERSGRP